MDGLGSARIDELLAIEAYFCLIHLIWVVELVKYIKILTRATHDVSILEVLEIVGRDLHHIILVRVAIVDIIIDDGAMGARIVEQTYDLRADHGVYGIEGAEKHDVIGLDVGIDEVELIVRMIFIEDVFGIVVLIEESQ